MGIRYTKSHSLWPVWDLQNQIILRGGIINRQSDLLSYFEGKSLIPDSNPVEILKQIFYQNYKIKNNILDLIKIDHLAYKKIKSIDFSSNTLRTSGLSPISGYSFKLPDYMQNDKERSEIGYFFKDNEFVININGITDIIVLNEKYIDIFRLIKNGYHPAKKEMKNKNNLFSAIILALGLIIASIIFAFANRYEVNNFLRYDKWTGTMEKMELKH
jgi:hypothetical protein